MHRKKDYNKESWNIHQLHAAIRARVFLELGSLGEDHIYPRGEKVDTTFQGQEQTVMDKITGEEHRRAE